MKLKLAKRTSTNPQTLEEYQEEISRLRKQMNKDAIIYHIALAALGIVTVISLLAKYQIQKNSKYVVVDENKIESTVTESQSKLREVERKYAYTKDGVDYYEVKIDKTKTFWTQEEVEKFIGDATQIETAIYELKFKNKDKYIGSFLENNVSLVRYSVKGESAYSKEEEDAYKTIVAYYFTNKKANTLSREDAEKYQEEMRNENTYSSLRNPKDLFKHQTTVEVKEEFESLMNKSE